MGRGFSNWARWVWPLAATLVTPQPALAAGSEQPAAEGPVRYRWSFVRLSGAETCPSAERIAAGVRARLGRDPFANGAERNIEGSVTRDGQVWRAHLSVMGPEGAVLGARDLQSSEPDCTTLADAVTLAVALVIDPRAALEPPSAETAPPATAQPALPPPARVGPPPVAPAPAPVVAAPAPSPPALAAFGSPVALSLRGTLSLGLLPRAAPGVESAGEVGITERWGLSAGVSYFPEVRTSDAGFAFGLSSAFLGACFTAARSKLARLILCGEGELGAMHAVVYSVRPLPPGDHLWAGFRVGPRLRLLLASGFWLEAGGMALAPLIRHEFVLKDQQDPVFQSSPLTFAGSLGLSASIR